MLNFRNDFTSRAIGILSLLVIVASILLAWTFAPGVLINRESEFVGFPAQTLKQEEDLLRAHNQSLREQISGMERLDQRGVCKQRDSLYLAPDPDSHLPSEKMLENLSPLPRDQADIVSPRNPSDISTSNPADSHRNSRKLNLAELLDRSAVLVLVLTKDKKTSMGSGFFITKNHILTNRHVVDNADSGALVANKILGKVVPAKIVAKTELIPEGEVGPDYAILQLDAPVDPPLMPIKTSARRMQKVVAAGFPAIVTSSDENFQELMNGNERAIPELNLTVGSVTAIQPRSSGFSMISHGAEISPGNSGGPLVDECGGVIGVNTFNKQEESGPHSLNLALGTDSLITFLKNHDMNVQIDSSECGNAVP
jgi:S1-C subfamily serine protease